MGVKKHGKGRERWLVARFLCGRWGHGPFRLVKVTGVDFAECRFCRAIVRERLTGDREFPVGRIATATRDGSGNRWYWL